MNRNYHINNDNQKEKIENPNKSSGDESKNFYKLKAASGDREDLFNYGCFLLQDPRSTDSEFMEGISLLKKSAEMGFPYAEGEYAYRCYYGKGLEKDEKMALSFITKALEYRERPQWLRLREAISKPKSNIFLSNAQKDLHSAFLYHDIGKIENRLDDDVIICLPMAHPTKGKTDVTETLDRYVTNQKFQVAYTATERYGMVVEVFAPNCKSGSIRILFMTRTNDKGLIDRIALVPSVWGDFCFSPGDMPFPWKQIIPQLNNELDTPATRNRGHMFCMKCGKLSHELKWINYKTVPDRYGYSYKGKMSVCPDCREQVEFICDSFEKVRNKKDEQSAIFSKFVSKLKKNREC